MKKITLLFCILVFILSGVSKAQIFYGYFVDSTGYRPGDSVLYSSGSQWMQIDTSGTQLWQLGKANKPYFSAGSDSTVCLMTDTLQPYPINANSWFIVKFRNAFSFPIFSFTHKYQTARGHDGGIVEYSIDSGASWQNVYFDSASNCHDVYVAGIYTANDSLQDGTKAFSGTSPGWQTAVLQFQSPVYGNCSSYWNWPTIYLRFRFVSDSIPDSLDGWIIKSFRIEHDIYEGIASIYKNKLAVSPNPSASGIFTFPVIENSSKYKMIISDIQGKVIKEQPYTTRLNITAFPSGVYFYRVSDGVVQYNGTLIRE